MKELEFYITNYTTDQDYYVIYYRPKRKFNLFNTWKLLVKVFYAGKRSNLNITNDQPVFFRDFDKAKEYAEYLKKNPDLIEKHIKEQNERFQQIIKERRKYIKSINKSEKI